MKKKDKTLNISGVDVKASDICPWIKDEEEDTWSYNKTTV